MSEGRPVALRQPGPAPLANDSWDEAFGDKDRYNGRRRAPEAARRRLLGLGAVVLVAVTTITAVAWSARVDHTSRTTPIPGSMGQVDAAAAREPVGGNTFLGSGPVTASGGSPAIDAIGQPSAGSGAGARATADAGSPFPEITIEAEAGSPTTVLTGPATVVSNKDASGGLIVTGLGLSGSGQPPGALGITGVRIPSAGTYRITLYFTNEQNGEPRAAVISMTGAEPRRVNYAGQPSCCGSREIDVSLSPGTLEIWISNPTEPAPAVDKIVISRA